LACGPRIVLRFPNGPCAVKDGCTLCGVFAGLMLLRANVVVGMFVTQACETGGEHSLLQLRSWNVDDMYFKTQNPRKVMLVEMHSV
jgi:hypothetical protein